MCNCAPRTRGGQSFSEVPVGSTEWCSPHTRGSVGDPGWTRVGHQVLPAHAGVSRLSAPSAGATCGAPRTRGGQSRPPPNYTRAAQCSPHTRGSVGTSSTSPTPSAVLPAHAGVSRPRRAPGGRSAGAPRTRGGQSQPPRCLLPPRRCSPHTRGSVGRPSRIRGAALVLPAHAGVSRRTSPSSRRAASAPRTRGGQSLAALVLLCDELCSPHTRGSVVVRMERGAQQVVLPAHAGVSRPADVVSARPPRAPRTRGGQSPSAGAASATISCSPHTRGSVGTVDDNGRYGSVLPAHAGVSRRGRGCTSVTANVCSPHTRGSVGGVGVDVGQERVLPASGVSPVAVVPAGVLPAHAGVSRARRSSCPP